MPGDKKPKRRGGPRQKMTAEERAAEVQQMLRMRTYGASYQAIADHFGIAKETAFRKIQQELSSIPREEVTNLRALEAAKLDAAELRLQDKIKSGNVGAINALVRVSESRRRLLGLDMPEQHEVKISREEESLIDQLVGALTEQQQRRAGEGDMP